MFLGINQETGGLHFTYDFRTSSPMYYTFLFVPQAWTLGIEVLFYLIAPFIVRRSNLIIIAIIIISLLIRNYIYSIGYINDPWTHRFFPSELALFLLGTVSYRLYDVYKIHQTKLLNANLTAIILGLLFTIVVFYPYIPSAGFNRHTLNWFIYAFFCLSIPFLFEFTKASKIDSRVGELSYPVYISHMLVLGALSPFLSLLGLQEYSGEFAIVFTLLFSCFLVKLIADPIERIRQSRVKLR